MRNPGSLWFHNTRLDCLPITLSSLPTFRVCRDLIFTSLYARVLHCLLLVAGVSSLEDYLQKYGKWSTLVSHTEVIDCKFTWPSEVERLRTKQANNPKDGDMVFENAVLFFRDALISREFSDAVKAGDLGRVLMVLKAWALGF